MKKILEKLVANTWNRLAKPPAEIPESGTKLNFGIEIVDGELQRSWVNLPYSKRTEHVVILGKTGQGKSYFLRYLCNQDVRNRNWFIAIDLHGDLLPYLLRLVAAEE